MIILGGPSVITRVLTGWRQEAQRHRESMGGMEQRSEGRRCYAADFEDGGRGPSAKECCSGIYKKQGNEFSPRFSRRYTNLLTPCFSPSKTDFRLPTSRTVKKKKNLCSCEPTGFE